MKKDNVHIDKNNIELNIIDNYFLTTNSNDVLKPKWLDFSVVNTVKLEHLFVEKDVITNEDLFIDDQIICFKKADLSSKVFPSVLTYFKPYLIQAKRLLKKEKNELLLTHNTILNESISQSHSDLEEITNYHLYFIFKLTENFNSIENKIYDFYLRQISKNNFGINSSVKSSISNKIKASFEYQEFKQKLANWYSTSELMILQFYIMSYFFGINFNYDINKFTVEQNLEFSIAFFAKKNFYKISSIILKNADIGMRMFGSVNFSSVAFILLSGFYGGATLSSLLWATRFAHYPLIGSYIFNWLVGSVTYHLDDHVATCEYYKISECLESLVVKLNEMNYCSVELLRMVILGELEKNTSLNELSLSKICCQNNNGIVEDTKPTFSDLNNKNYPNYNEELNKAILGSKIEELKLLVNRYLSKIEDISEDEIKQIDIQSTKWVEEVVKYEDILSDNLINGSVVFSNDHEDLKKELNEKKDLNEDWILINVIKQKMKG